MNCIRQRRRARDPLQPGVAVLINPVYEVDWLGCAQCGRAMKRIALIEPPNLFTVREPCSQTVPVR